MSFPSNRLPYSNLKALLSVAAVAAVLSFMLPSSLAFSSSSKKLLHRYARAAGHHRRSSSSLFAVGRESCGQLSSLDYSIGKRRSGRSHRYRSASTKTKPFIRTTTSSSLFMSDDKIIMATPAPEKRPKLLEDDDAPIEDDESTQGDEDAIVDQILQQSNNRPPTPPPAEFRSDYQDITNKFTTADTRFSELIPGVPETNRIINHATIPPGGFTQGQIDATFSEAEIKRLKLRPEDVTVPIALRLLFPDAFGTLTRARKESRRNKILLYKGELLGADEGVFDREKLAKGRVGDRVMPGDTLAIQTRTSHNYGEVKNHHDEPPFHLPVVWEDDHFAIVNKPEGIVTYSHKHGGFGRHNVYSCLPWALTPPTPGVISVMRRPCPVHRIDRGTSGLLVCAKTKPAMVDLGRQFKERKIKKTYTAIVNGNIKEPKESSISSQEAVKLGICIGDGEESDWQLIDEEIEGQTAVTIWRTLKQWPLYNARMNTVSLVELKPKTGRYHQLRRHMAWESKCPLLGDKSYDGGGLAKTLRGEGFYLCSNRVTLEHPYYNTPQGRKAWDAKKDTLLGETSDGKIKIEEDSDGTILLHCQIDLPAKFSDDLAATFSEHGETKEKVSDDFTFKFSETEEKASDDLTTKISEVEEEAK